MERRRVVRVGGVGPLILEEVIIFHGWELVDFTRGHARLINKAHCKLVSAFMCVSRTLDDETYIFEVYAAIVAVWKRGLQLNSTLGLLS